MELRRGPRNSETFGIEKATAYAQTKKMRRTLSKR